MSSVTAWAEKTGTGVRDKTGGGRSRGRTLPNPVRVEFVTEDGWDAPGAKVKVEGQPANQRLRLPLLEVRQSWVLR